MISRIMHVRAGAIGVLSLFASLLWGSQAFAGSLQVSPAYVDYTIEPGGSVSYQVQIKNTGTDGLDVLPAVTDFYYNEIGEKVFVDAGMSPGEERFSIRKWVTTDSSDEPFTLESGEFKSIKVTIAIPEDAEPGGHYGVLFFSMLPKGAGSSGGTQIGVSGRLGSLIYVDVPGFIVRDAEITSFVAGVQEGTGAAEKFYENSSFESGPLSFRIQYHNKGTTHYYPEGTITVEGGYRKEKWELPVQPVSESDKIRVVPRVTRDFFVTLNQRKLFGKYTATLAMEDGDGDQLTEQSIEFWVMPLKTVLFWALLVIVGLVLLTVLVKRYNRWISSRAMKRQ